MTEAERLHILFLIKAGVPMAWRGRGSKSGWTPVKEKQAIQRSINGEFSFSEYKVDRYVFPSTNLRIPIPQEAGSCIDAGQNPGA